jgi:hypothetical protein
VCVCVCVCLCTRAIMMYGNLLRACTITSQAMMPYQRIKKFCYECMRPSSLVQKHTQTYARKGTPGTRKLKQQLAPEAGSISQGTEDRHTMRTVHAARKGATKAVYLPQTMFNHICRFLPSHINVLRINLQARRRMDNKAEESVCIHVWVCLCRAYPVHTQ